MFDTVSDDNGLVLPPKIAPKQVVILPIRNDDLVNDFQYNFPHEESITQPRIRAELQKMLKKYIKQMEIEQELMRKGKL